MFNYSIYSYSHFRFITSSAKTVWTIDKPHCFVNFSIGHMFSVVTGRFKDFKGDFRFGSKQFKGE
ncbi:YceI family protein [Chryseobacterium indoltheticum]|uniref:YceI family protein n=1 Tax=Chryseobacterium indoltheticum TaxID=254 RepID=UPI003F4951DE